MGVIPMFSTPLVLVDKAVHVPPGKSRRTQIRRRTHFLFALQNKKHIEPWHPKVVHNTFIMLPCSINMNNKSIKCFHMFSWVRTPKFLND